MRIAVLADVHGNLAALEAVLTDIQHLAPDFTVNLGDLVSGPFDPAGSAEAQMTAGVITVAGNHERQLLDDSTGAFDVLARPLLSDAHWEWIRGLPKSVALADGEVFACHGSPAGGDLDYLLENISSGRAVLDSEDAIAARLAGSGDARVVLCGHTHTPRIATINSILVVNPGSVGMPAYRGRGLTPHVMEAGTPLARYAVIERRSNGWSVELRAIPYAFEIAARQAEQFGFSAFAYSLRTGRMLPTEARANDQCR